MTTGRKILLAVVSVIALALIAAAVYMGISMHMDTVYTEILESGEKYMAAGDYDNAVITYQQAIETNEEDEEGYLGLANAYIAREEFEMAEATLQTGIEKTHSARLSLLYDNLLRYSHSAIMRFSPTLSVPAKFQITVFLPPSSWMIS